MNECDPKDVAIKSFFVGPQAENGDWLKVKWNQILEHWLHWRKGLFPQDGLAISDGDKNLEEFQMARAKLDQAIARILKDLESETPKFTPRYIGHMVSEVSLPAMLGHVCALLHNPNNTSREVSRVTSRLEDEAIADLGAMVGFGDTARGHFTSGGTLANFEALWRAIVKLDGDLSKKLSGVTNDSLKSKFSFLELGPWRFAKLYHEITGEDFPGPVILVPRNKHFSWEKGAVMMGLGSESFWSVELDEYGRMNIEDLKSKVRRAEAERRPIVMVVSVLGTTELGQVDAIADVADFLEAYKKDCGLDIWHHVDAAYGGYYCSYLRGESFPTLLSDDTQASLLAVGRVDSITLDPHKLGYVPYACGAFIARDELRYRTYSSSAPYLQSKNQSRWATTLEGSRSGAGAAATWLSNRVMGLNREGYGRLLEKGLEARNQMREQIARRLPNAIFAAPSDLNILCFCLACEGECISNVNARSERIFAAFEQSPNFSISRTRLSGDAYGSLIQNLAASWKLKIDEDSLLTLRLVLMNPFILSKETETNFVEAFVTELSTYDLDHVSVKIVPS